MLSPTQTVGGRYELGALIGRGSLARVFRAHDRVLDRPVAVKLYGPELAADATFRRRLEAKARAAAQLVHSHAVTIYDVGLESDQAYLVMELVEGTTLRALLEAEGSIEAQRAVLVGAQILEGIAAAHAQGIVHGDLRPEHVLVDERGQIRVSDFSVAHVAATTLAVAAKALEQRAGYLAPELIRGAQPSTRTDVYGVAAVLYELLSGRTPYTGAGALSVAARKLDAPPPALRLLNPEIPVWLERLIGAGLHPDPERRPVRAEAFRRALLSPPQSAHSQAPASPILVPTAAPARRPAPPGLLTPTERIRRRLKETKRAALVPMLLLVAVLGGAFYLASQYTGRVVSGAVENVAGVEVPDLRGKSVADASSLAKTRDFTLLRNGEEPANGRPPGTVVDQTPPPGERQRSGGTIRIVVTAGGAQAKAAPNLAQGRPVVASGGEAPQAALDGREDTVWNAGHRPPATIEFTLEGQRSIRRVELVVAQTPAGDTVHSVIAVDAAGTEREVHVFRGSTADGKILAHDFEPPLTGVSRIKIASLSGPSWVAWRELRAFGE
ncbi:MAG: protein kinase [Chloroflexi bacterium]|nr:protein kinase [Chloroflexota bacterium]